MTGGAILYLLTGLSSGDLQSAGVAQLHVEIDRIEVEPVRPTEDLKRQKRAKRHRGIAERFNHRTTTARISEQSRTPS
jgi:hypothetical protein